MSLEQVKKKISQKYLKKDMPDPLVSPKKIEYYSSGFLTLDNILGGGWAKGKIIELWGTPGAGKTTIALQSITTLQKKGNNCAFIDVERAFNPEYALNLGVDIKRLVYIKPEYGEQALDIAYDLAESGEIALIVLDSVASLLPKDVTERTMEQREQALLARMLSRNIPKLAPILDNSGCTFLFVNQIRKEVGKLFGNPDTTPGGEVLKYNSFMRVELRHTEYLSEKEHKVADLVRFSCKKTKSTIPFQETIMRLDFGKGFSQAYDLFQHKLSIGEIVKAGAWYLYNDKKYQGEDTIVEILGVLSNE